MNTTYTTLTFSASIIGSALFFSQCSSSHKKEQNTQKPNIIVIMSDDMGFSDLCCYGSEIKTPNLDRLAENGIRLTQFYNTARCCPTRASLLTGLYPHQAGMGWMTDLESDIKSYQGDLTDECVTLAEVAKSAGYSTFMTGKWHVSRNVRDDGPKYNWPLQRGFQRYYGTIQGAGSYWDPASLCRGNNLISPFTDSLYKTEDYYYTDAISDVSIRFIRERDKDAPFFMYVAYTAAHWPLHARPEDIEKYKGVYDDGWESVREQRYNRLKKLGLISPGTELSPLDVHPWEKEENKEVQSGRMEIYAAMIDELDQGIGRIIETLKEQGIFDNTVIFFLQDNGGCAEEIGTMGETSPQANNPDTEKPLNMNEIQYQMFPSMTRSGKYVMKGKGIKGGPDSTYVSYGKVWANASNTPFREYKHWVHEGGISTPLIIHYPEGIKNRNSLCYFPGHVIDIMPTIVELTGASYPATYNNHSILPMEGVSLVPLFQGKSVERDGPIFWEHEANRALRSGDWKLVSKGELFRGPYGQWENFRFGEWELYNIKNDRSELHNLAAQYPEKVTELSAIWDEYANRLHVFPAPWKLADED